MASEIAVSAAEKVIDAWCNPRLTPAIMDRLASIIDAEFSPVLAEKDAEIERLKSWRTAVVEAAVVNWTYKAEHENDPKAAINSLICMAQKEACDPLVSEEAARLHGEIERLQRENAELKRELHSIRSNTNA